VIINGLFAVGATAECTVLPPLPLTKTPRFFTDAKIMLFLLIFLDEISRLPLLNFI